MTYYRLAIQDRQTARWSWKTTPITSLKAVFELLRCYRALLPQDRIRVCTASSKEELNEQLSRENNGQTSGSVTAIQFLQDKHFLVPERAQNTWQQSASAQEAQQGATVAMWVKDLWEQHVAMRKAQAAQQGAHTVTSFPLQEPLASTGTAEGLGKSMLDQKRLEIELGPEGDHDVPYSFALPVSMPQALVLMRLLARVQRGELVP
jgi:hypothetical protein